MREDTEGRASGADVVSERSADRFRPRRHARLGRVAVAATCCWVATASAGDGATRHAQWAFGILPGARKTREPPDPQIERAH